MGHKRLRPSFETPRKRAAPQMTAKCVWFGKRLVYLAWTCDQIDPRKDVCMQ
jgi:hypothetical protein